MTSRTAVEAFLAEPRNVIVAGIRKDGRPHVSPNWFFWDGERFYVSTTRPRVKYKIFSRDPRVELVVDDATGHRYVALSGTVEILEDVKPNLHLLPRHPREARPRDPARRHPGRRPDRRRPGPAGHYPDRAPVRLDRRRPRLTRRRRPGWRPVSPL